MSRVLPLREVSEEEAEQVHNTISELKPDIRICVIFLAKYVINSLYQVWIRCK